MERKLAAILSADVVGYSRLMGVDEDATLVALRAHREVVDALIEAHRGRVFNTAGDSVVAEFPSAVEASLCAVEIQKEVTQRNESVPAERQLIFRIGINIGDVVADGGNLFGDGVNIADRVQKLADPGGICVSRNVRDQLTSKAGFRLDPMGAFRVKNIASSIDVFRLRLGDDGNRLSVVKRLAAVARINRRIMAIVAAVFALVAGTAFWIWQQKSHDRDDFPLVSVLHFQNLSRDTTLDSFADGVAEDLTTSMSRFPDLTVASRNAVFAGQDLNVDYLVEGSVQRKGGAVRINAQLIDAHTDAHIWADAYEGTDPSVLQDEVIGKIANALASEDGAIRKHEYNRTRDKAKADFSEYDYFLSGHEIMSKASSIEDHDRAGAIWQEGLQQFPNSPLLRVALAWYHFFRPWNYDTGKGAADYRQAAQLASEALSGQNVPPEVQWSGRKLMAYIYWFNGNFERAVADAEAAVALAPFDADTLSFLARVQVASGNTTRALEWVQESMRFDSSVQRNTRILSWIYYLTGQYEKSIEAAKEHQQLSRMFGGDASAFMAASYVRLGRVEDARATIRRALESEPQWTLLQERSNNLSRPYKDPEVVDRLIADLAVAGLPEVPFGYDGKSKDRLSAEEIRTLIFGQTFQGKDIRTGASFKDAISLEGTINTTGDFGEDKATLVYLGNATMCYRSNDWGMRCAAIFRDDKEESQPAKSFIMLDNCCEYQYSVE